MWWYVWIAWLIFVALLVARLWMVGKVFPFPSRLILTVATLASLLLFLMCLVLTQLGSGNTIGLRM